MTSTPISKPMTEPIAGAVDDGTTTGKDGAQPFRFYDNRQKYLAFVTTCNEKVMIANRASKALAKVRPVPPALRIFDAGMGDATVLSRLMRSAHRYFPTVPLVAVAKEISVEDVRLGLDKMPDRFFEHPHSVVVITNLNYADAPGLLPNDADKARELNWQEVRLSGSTAHEFGEQIEELMHTVAFGWETHLHPTSGNPTYVRPSVLVLYRADHEFLLDSVIPRPRQPVGGYDFVLASQPWRARTSAEFKAKRILAPLARSLALGGQLMTVQSVGRDPGVEVVQMLWPDEEPFVVGRAELLDALRAELGASAAAFDLSNPTDGEALFQYQMHTLPTEIGDRIGTSTLFAAWNAVTYVNQIEDERLDSVVKNGSYLEATQKVLHRNGGMWFNDEAFVVTRHGRDG